MDANGRSKSPIAEDISGITGVFDFAGLFNVCVALKGSVGFFPLLLSIGLFSAALKGSVGFFPLLLSIGLFSAALKGSVGFFTLLITDGVFDDACFIRIPP